jgi:hypothetical protein
MHRKELLKDLTAYIQNQTNINEIILARDLNQDMYSQEIEAFIIESSLYNIKEITNESESLEKDSTYLHRLKYIDLIAASPGLINYINGYKITDFNKLIITNHYKYIVD